MLISFPLSDLAKSMIAVCFLLDGAGTSFPSTVRIVPSSFFLNQQGGNLISSDGSELTTNSNLNSSKAVGSPVYVIFKYLYSGPTSKQ